MTDSFDSNTSLLIQYKNGDSTACEALVSNNLGLVKSIAIRFTGRGTDFEDLVQIGCLGLLKAVKGYDSSFGTVFSTYAVPLITGEIKRHLRDDGIIKISRSTKRNGYLINKKREEIILKTGAEPKLSELAELCGLSLEDTIYALDASKPTISLQQKISDDGETELLDFCAANDEIDTLCDSFALSQAIESLDETEKQLITLRYYKGLTQSSTAKVLNMTQVGVSRAEKKILNKLRGIFL